MTFTYEMLIRILVERLGFVVLDDDEQDDFAISDYVTDSITFIQLLIAIEAELGKELTDDFLNYDILSSAKGFTEKLDCYVESLQNNNSADTHRDN